MRSRVPLMHLILALFSTTFILLAAAWGSFALWYQLPGGKVVKILALAVWIALSIAAMIYTWQGHLGSALGGFALLFVLMLVWWQRIAPSNDRRWARDVAQMSYGQIDGEQIVLHNVRNFSWRTNTEYTERWETRSFDLQKLNSADMILSHWSGPAIAHMLISFGFEDGRHLAFSVEIRRELNEDFSELGGFFKQFELAIIACEELDVVRVRTNVRREDAYLYRLRMPRSDMRALFVGYVRQANALLHAPQFYNTITTNCTTLVYEMMKRIVGYLPLDWRVLITGYLPAYVYRVGGLDDRYSLEQLTAFGHISERARLADTSASFSADIRQGIPALDAPP